MGPLDRLISWLVKGSDPFYANYEKSLARATAELEKLRVAKVKRQQLAARVNARFLGAFAAVYAAVLAYAGWVHRQPAGAYTYLQHSKRVFPVVALPPAALLLHRVLNWLPKALDRRTGRRIAAVESKVRKMVHELKDSTHYEQTLALLQRYDPDFVPPQDPRTALAQLKAGQPRAGQTPPSHVSKATSAAVNAAAQTLHGAGSRMFPVLAKLWAHAADTLIADDPVLVSLMNEAKQEADCLRQRMLRLEAENATLRQQLGLAPAEEPGGAALAPAEKEGVESEAAPSSGAADVRTLPADAGPSEVTQQAGDSGGQASDPPGEAEEEEEAAAPVRRRQRRQNSGA